MPLCCVFGFWWIPWNLNKSYGRLRVSFKFVLGSESYGFIGRFEVCEFSRMEEILQKTRKILLSVEESEKQFERDFEVNFLVVYWAEIVVGIMVNIRLSRHRLIEHLFEGRMFSCSAGDEAQKMHRNLNMNEGGKMSLEWKGGYSPILNYLCFQRYYTIGNSAKIRHYNELQ